MRILGIDPGTVVIGYACLELPERSEPGPAGQRPLAQRIGNAMSRPAGYGGGRARVVDAGAVRLGGRTAALPDRLCALARALDELVDRLAPDELALEDAFTGKSAQSAMRIGEARGVVLAGARGRGLEIHQFAPARIKRAVAGHGGANKEAVADMVCRQLGLTTPPRPADVTDALAVALCRIESAWDFQGPERCNRRTGRM